MAEYRGIFINFNNGACVTAPAGCFCFRVRFTDMSTGKVEDDLNVKTHPEKSTEVSTFIKYFVPWRVEIWPEDGGYFRHEYNANGETVVIDLSFGALGDSVAWMPAVDAFRKKWRANIICGMKDEHACMFRDPYPEIKFMNHDSLKKLKRCDLYACYIVAVFGYDLGKNFERIDFRKNNLQIHADMILGVDSQGKRPKIDGNITCGNQKPFVCIATRASRKCKEWNNLGAWEQVTRHLIDSGYDVFCIDADDQNKPLSAIDDTGKKPLLERIAMLNRASLFIGLPSGLSWIAWACGVPVVLISGFTDVVRPDAENQRYPEFDTPYRVSPPDGVCRNCWMDCDQREKARFDECYHRKNNECTRTITPEMVIEMCEKALEDNRV